MEVRGGAITRRRTAEPVSCPCHDRSAQPRRFTIGMLLVFGGAWFMVSPSAWAQPASDTAALNVLAGDVKVLLPGEATARAATNGMTVAAGTQVQTGKKSRALVTFLNGSTLTVEPESDITIKQAEGAQKRSRVTIGINLGTVWARVVKLVDPESAFSLQSNTATATVHDGLIGARQEADGTFTCWTREGELWLLDPTGRARSVMKPGQMDIVKGTQPSAPHPFFSNHSALRIAAPPSILPLVIMPDQARVAGFLARGIEANHVFGSYTGGDANGQRVVEVPAGTQGPFTVILKGEAEGPFQVTIAGLYKGEVIQQRQVSGTIKRGDRLSVRIMQQLEPGPDDPKTAKIARITVGDPEATTAPLPGVISALPWGQIETK